MSFIQATSKVATVAAGLAAGIFIMQMADQPSAKAHAQHENKVQAQELCTGFAPENEMKIPVGHRVPGRWSNAGITEQQFNEVIDRLEVIYGPEIQKMGGSLIVNRKWSDPTVNASAQRMGNRWIVNMYGGLARHPLVTMDGFATVMCHEIGHHIGGAPKVTGWWGNDWATNEGGSDYWASLKCLRRYFEGDDNQGMIELLDVHPIVKTRCEAEHSSSDNRAKCMRAAAAAMSVTSLLSTLGKEKELPKFDAPDTKVVTRTNDNHPAAQCRLDTYFAGATCYVNEMIPVSQTNYREGSCVSPQNSVGIRPLCWFKPD
jgi:hypothetical protein